MAKIKRKIGKKKPVENFEISRKKGKHCRKNWVRTGKKMVKKSKTQNLRKQRKFKAKSGKKFERNRQKRPKTRKKCGKKYENPKKKPEENLRKNR